MKKLLILLLSILASQLKSQPETYKHFITEAQALYEKGDYPASAKAFSSAFESNGWKGYLQDRYNAARAWSMAGVPDSAFFNLFRITEKLHFDRLNDLKTEKAFDPLHAEPRWELLCAKVKANLPAMPELVDELAVIWDKDQKYRQMIDSVEKRFGRQSPEMKDLWELIEKSDKENEARVCQILDEKGWLGPKDVGDLGASALFLVIQHAPLTTQEKYLPGMRDAVKNGKASGSDLALLEDRVLMRNGKKQIYGSQVVRDPVSGEMVFAAIEDVDHVDERRASVGLGPLAEYAQYFGIVWDAAAIEKNKKADPPPSAVKKQ